MNRDTRAGFCTTVCMFCFFLGLWSVCNKQMPTAVGKLAPLPFAGRERSVCVGGSGCRRRFVGRRSSNLRDWSISKNWDWVHQARGRATLGKLAGMWIGEERSDHPRFLIRHSAFILYQQHSARCLKPYKPIMCDACSGRVQQRRHWVLPRGQRLFSARLLRGDCIFRMQHAHS